MAASPSNKGQSVCMYYATYEFKSIHSFLCIPLCVNKLVACEISQMHPLP